MLESITKEAIIKELHGVINIKRKQDTVYYVFGRLKPLKAGEFYPYIYCKLKESLEVLFQNPDGLDEYFDGYSGPLEIACALVQDCEKECAEVV